MLQMGHSQFWSSGERYRQIWVLVTTLFLVCKLPSGHIFRWPFLGVQWKEQTLVSPLARALTPSWGPQPHDLILPYLPQMPSLWRLELQ